VTQNATVLLLYTREKRRTGWGQVKGRKLIISQPLWTPSDESQLFWNYLKDKWDKQMFRMLDRVSIISS